MEKGKIPDLYLLARRAYPLIKKYYEENPDVRKRFSDRRSGGADSEPHDIYIPVSRTVVLGEPKRYSRG